MYTPRLYKAQMPRFLCTVYTYSTRLRLGITYTHSFGTDTNLTSVEIKRMIKSSPGQIICSIQSTCLTTLELYKLSYIPEESILALLDSCTSNLKSIYLPGNPNITDNILLKIFQKFGHSLKSLELGSWRDIIRIHWIFTCHNRAVSQTL